jgi:hypothetical protein
LSRLASKGSRRVAARDALHGVHGRGAAGRATRQRHEGGDVQRLVAVQRVAALARYACALSPALGPESYLHPNPADLDLIQEDDASRALLAEALQASEALAARDVADDERRENEEFALACLCNPRDRLPGAATPQGVSCSCQVERTVDLTGEVAA